MTTHKDVSRQELDKFVSHYKRDTICKMSDTYNGSCMYYEDCTTGAIIARFFIEVRDGVRFDSGHRIYT